MAALKNYWRRLSAGSAWGAPQYDIQTEEMSSLDSDVLFSWQLGGDEFERLTADSLLKVGVCGTLLDYDMFTIDEVDISQTTNTTQIDCYGPATMQASSIQQLDSQTRLKSTGTS